MGLWPKSDRIYCRVFICSIVQKQWLKNGTSDVKINTITEGGYNLNEATGAFNFDNPQIIHDIKMTMLQ
jgi:mannitol-1-phosphate/altronate dehydrogenase